MGQSNIQRWFNTPTAVADGAAPTYMMNAQGTVSAVRGGAANYFADAYAGLAGVPVLIVAAAEGGTALTPEADKGNGHWLDTSSGSLYGRALDLLARVGGSAELVLWAQGETDASDGVTTSAYASALTTFMQRVLADFGVDKVLIQEIGPRGANDGRYDGVREAQHQVANALAGVDIGAITTDLLTVEDGIHLSGTARLMAADRMLVSAAATLGIDLTRALQTGADNAAGSDTLTGTAGRDELRGLAGNDVLDGGADSDVILGGAGNDTIRGGSGMDFLNGDAGDDLIQGGDDADVISGGDGNDTIEGGAGADEIWADAGDDRVTGGLGNDVMFGGAGYDTAVFLGRFADYSISISGGTITVRDLNLSDGDEGRDTLQGFEQLVFSDRTYNPLSPGLPSLFTNDADTIDFAFVTAGTYAPTSLYNALGGNDEVYLPRDAAAAMAAGYDSAMAFDAGAGDDVVIGGSLNDLIRGGDGNDILDGGAGSDRLEGGRGNDIYYVDVTSVDGSGDLVVERPDEGIDTVMSTVTHTLKSNVENLTLLGARDINGTGNDLANVIEGNEGRNTINGNAGNDVIYGRGGDDTLRGGTGNDTIDGGQGRDTAVFAGLMAGYTISVTNGVVTVTDINTADGDEGTDTITNVEILRFSDTSFTVPVGPVSPPLFTAGADTLDFANVVAGAYMAGTQYDALAGDDQVRLAQDAAAAARAGYDPTLAFNAGAGNDIVIGGSLNDTILGGSGNDSLSGGGGNDVLRGGTGTNVLNGGTGRDTFVLDAPQNAHSTLEDFRSGEDRIALDRAGFGLSATGSLGAANVSLQFGSTATGSGPTLLVNSATKQLLWDSDGAGAAQASVIATIPGLPAGASGAMTASISTQSVAQSTPVLGLGRFDSPEGPVGVLQSSGGTIQLSSLGGSQATPLAGLAGCTVLATGDFSGDRIDDLFIRRESDGFLGFATMQGGQVATTSFLFPTTDWKLVGTGDFNADGTQDMFWQNSRDGMIAEWLMRDGQIADARFFFSVTDWTLVATGDFNGDRSDDLLWQRKSDGMLASWEMQNGQIGRAVYHLAVPEWTVEGTGDVTRDGTDDIVLRRDGDGAVAVWTMKNGVIAAGDFLPTRGAGDLIDVVDVTSDGAADLVWSNPGTSELTVWDLNRQTPLTASDFIII